MRAGPTVSRVLRAAAKFERSLTADRERPSYFGVMERGGWSGRMHLHFLVSGAERSTRLAAFVHSVQEGFSSVTSVSRPMSASQYVAKYVSKDSVCDEAFIFQGGPLWLSR